MCVPFTSTVQSFTQTMVINKILRNNFLWFKQFFQFFIFIYLWGFSSFSFELWNDGKSFQNCVENLISKEREKFLAIIIGKVSLLFIIVLCCSLIMISTTWFACLTVGKMAGKTDPVCLCLCLGAHTARWLVFNQCPGRLEHIAQYWSLQTLHCFIGSVHALVKARSICAVPLIGTL